MKQMSTGFGLAVLGACVLGAAFIASPRFGQQAFAQSTGDRRIVSASVLLSGMNQYGITEKWGYRIWSDNVIEMKVLSFGYLTSSGGGVYFYVNQPLTESSLFKNWTQVDNGLTAFVPTDVDVSGTVDSGDVANVLLDFGATQAGNPPPPIDCTINAPR